MIRIVLAGAMLAASVAPGWAQQAVGDIYSAPFAGETAITVGGGSVQPGRAFKCNCTQAGTITFTYKDGTTGTWSVVVGSQTLPIALQALTASTATCTYANLK